jgi:DNA-binding NtrC family response regulator
VLFTDVVMPGKMTGLDLVSWCRQHRPTLPTVVATGYTTQQNSHGALILNKPYKIEDLVASLREAARR